MSDKGHHRHNDRTKDTGLLDHEALQKSYDLPSVKSNCESVG